jgi:hypothetical protein
MTIGKKADFALKALFAGALIFALMVTMGCLNPLSFNPNDLPAIKVTGEISIDNINSAELNFRNHTQSVDVTRVDIMQYRLETSSSFGEGGSSLPGEVENLDARISGSPTAGTQDSVLVRPTGTNVTNEITVKRYLIKVWYKKAQNFPPELEGKFTDLQRDVTGTPLEVELDELPRGRCVFHIYRHTNGNIAIDVDGASDDPDYTDHRNDEDFVMNVKSQTKIDLSGLEIGVNLPPVTIAGQPVEIAFSQELLDTVNATFGGLTASVDNIAASISDFALAVESYRVFGKDTGMLIVMNWSPKPVKVEVPSGGSHTYVIGPVATGDMDGMLLSTKDGNKFNLRVSSEGQQIQIKNTFVFNQKVSYLHVYVNQGGNVVSDITESPIRPEDAKLGYGKLRVKNHSSVEITNIVFKKKVGIGAGTTYDDSKSFVVQKVGPGTESQYSSVASDRVEEGNYAVFCSLEDGSIVFNGFDFYVLPDDVAYQAGDNVIEIWPSHITPPPPPVVTYTVLGDGGPPASSDSDFYATTKITIIFSSLPGPFSFEKITMNSGAGSPVRISDTVYEVEITNPETETAKFKLNGANLDNSEHQVQIYKKDGGVVGFVPVTDVIVLNNEKFTKGTPKTIQWKVIPENATNTAALWTLGEADGNLFLAQILGTTPPYGLGADGKRHTDPEGRLTVRTSYGRDYLYLAVIVQNGKAPGTRNPRLQELSEPVVDTNGTSVTVTIQALNYDPAKDFVKLFKFTSPDVVPPPPPPPPSQTTNVVLNYLGRGAGGNHNYPGGEWSVNLIEVYKRPTALYKPKNGTGEDTRSGDGDKYNDVTDQGGGILTYGNPQTGKTGVHWQANPMDELNHYWGGTSEGWIDGSKKPDGNPFDNADQNALQFLPYPAVPGTENTAIAARDRENMAFAYWSGGYYNAYRRNFRGETRTNFIGSLRMDGYLTGHENSLVGVLRGDNGDGRLNSSGEQYIIALPLDKGPLWLRLRMDYSDGTVGYWWKATYLQEWFVFDPSKTYTKDSNGSVIIDVDLYATPYMTYRK